MSSKSTICASRAVRGAGVLLLMTASACTQVRGRKKVQEGNELYKRGRYQDAVASYEEAERLVPELPTLWLNKGYTCRQLIAPGGKDPESRRAAACALASFRRLGELAPKDPRAGELTIQTWFDSDDFPSLERTFLERHRQAPEELEVVRGLQEVYFKWGKWPQALEWSKRAAALRPSDPETQYSVGTFIWQILTARGGGTEMAAVDPWLPFRSPAARPDGAGDDSPRPPPPAINDIGGALRVELADQGIAYLARALALRPRYPEAMTYTGLIWRQKSFAFLDDPIAWQGAVDQAVEWQRRGLAARAGKS